MIIIIRDIEILSIRRHRAAPGSLQLAWKAAAFSHDGNQLPGLRVEFLDAIVVHICHIKAAFTIHSDTVRVFELTFSGSFAFPFAETSTCSAEFQHPMVIFVCDIQIAVFVRGHAPG